ncbi:uncharacterized protein LOC117123259 [Anneissia japonica]|uniref:uncharacterized protein LOC117123259 n=1 Tax=Anneissia japonica TaxID=1529436 RepID=UPI0014258717|nr:uncharacterized protein LOC117123259 [Anneissia japonica]
MAVRMRDLGHTGITTAALVTKLKNLRAEFKAVRDVYIRGTGKGTTISDDPSKASCPHYHALNEILGGKPSVNPPAILLGQSSNAPPQPRPRNSSTNSSISSNNTSTNKTANRLLLEGTPICVVCKEECGSHKCKVCGKPTHIIPPCLGEQNEEGFGSKVTCKRCLVDDEEVSLLQEDENDDVVPPVPPKKSKIFGWEDEYDDFPSSPSPQMPASSLADASLAPQPQSIRQLRPTNAVTPATPVMQSSSRPIPTTPSPSSSQMPHQEAPSVPSRLRRRRPDSENDDGHRSKKDRTVDAVTKSLKEMQEYNFKRWKTIDERQEAELRKAQTNLESKIDKVVSVIGQQMVERREERQQNKEFQQQFLSILSQSVTQQHHLGRQQSYQFSQHDGHQQQWHQL